MRKILTSAMAAVLAAGAVMATAGPASAERYRHYRHHRGGGDDEVAAAILGGVAGLALGAALSSGSSRRDRGGYYYYDNGYRYDPRYDSYSRGYYRGGGYYDDGYYDRGRRYAYRTCVTRDRVYDPYIGRRVVIERRYAC
jgi:hypothetical protein